MIIQALEIVHSWSIFQAGVLLLGVTKSRLSVALRSDICREFPERVQSGVFYQ